MGVTQAVRYTTVSESPRLQHFAERCHADKRVHYDDNTCPVKSRVEELLESLQNSKTLTNLSPTIPSEEFALRSIIEPVANGILQYEPFNFKKGRYYNANNFELAELEFQALKYHVRSTNRIDQAFDEYLNLLEEQEKPSKKQLSSHFQWRVLHWTNNYTTPLELRRRFDEHISRQSLALILVYLRNEEEFCAKKSTPCLKAVMRAWERMPIQPVFELGNKAHEDLEALCVWKLTTEIAPHHVPGQLYSEILLREHPPQKLRSYLGALERNTYLYGWSFLEHQLYWRVILWNATPPEFQERLEKISTRERLAEALHRENASYTHVESIESHPMCGNTFKETGGRKYCPHRVRFE